ncbi:MAG: translocation/assembly module TamB domain-containing protein, partial [Verrucomicrobiales bacterium]|nr:translocation/assembly module TamB domain-containing protein [Verrucomicrobiales bacterium]
MSSDPAPNSGASSKTNRRRLSKRLKRFFLFSGSVTISLALLIFILAGPAFSSVSRWAGLKAAATQGISGDLNVEGNLFSGFIIREVELTGEDSPLVSLSLESVEINYDLLKVISAAREFNWLNLLSVKNAVIELKIPITNSESDTATRPSAEKVSSSDFSPLWNLLNSEIEIENISVAMQIEEERYKLGSLSLKASSERERALKIESIVLPRKDPIAPLSVRLQHENRALRLDQFNGKEIESLKHLTLKEITPGEWVVDAGITLGGGQISVFANSAGLVTLDLPAAQSIDLAGLPSLDDAPQLEGTISELALRFEGDFATPASWMIEGKIFARNLAIDSIGIDSLALLLTENQIELNAITPGASVSALVSAPLNSATSTEDLATMPIGFAADLKIESLEELLSGWDIDIPVSGKIDGRIENVQWVGGTSLRSGSALIASDTLQWNGEALTHLQFAAQVPETGEIKLAAEAGLDESTKAKLNGSFSLPSMSYTGTLEGEFNTDGLLGGVLERLAVSEISGAGTLRWNGAGTFEQVEHHGNATFGARNFRYGGGQPLEIALDANYKDARILIPTIRVNSDSVSLSGKAAWEDSRITVDDLAIYLSETRALTLNASLPFNSKSSETLIRQDGDVAITLTASDLAVEELALLFLDESPITGKLNGHLGTSGTWDAINTKGRFDFRPTLEVVQGDPALDIEMNVSGSVSRPESWKADLGAILSGLKWNEVQLGDVNFRAATREFEGRKALDATINAEQEGASLTAEARLDLTGAATIEDLQESPLNLKANFEAPNLAPLWEQLAPPAWRNLPVAGQLSLDLSDLRFQSGDVLSGKLDVFSDTLRIDGETLEKIDLSARVENPNGVATIFALYADSLSQIDGTASYHLVDQVFDANLDLDLDLKSEGALKRLLGNREIARLLPGSATLALRAEGNAIQKTGSGEFDLDGRSLTLADDAATIDSFNFSGNFSDSSLSTVLNLRSEPLDLDGQVEWNGSRLEVTELKASSDGNPVFSATASAPLSKDKLTAAKWFSQEGPLSLQFSSDPVALKTLTRLVNNAPPVDGDLDLDILINGTPAQPEVDLALAVSNIALPQQDNMKVGALNLSLKTTKGKAILQGKYQHPDINPLVINASLPFFPKEWALKERDVSQEQINASARMEKSTLAFLSTQVPAIKSIEGNVALDAAVTGSIATPLISGDGMLDVSRLRLNNRDAPSFYDIDLKTRFAENRLTIERLNAIVAGGKVDASGTIDFAPQKEPRFDLSLGAEEALVFRTPDLSLRTDAALTLTGPFSAATLAGSIGITNSRFFKNFDLLPQTLPTRNTSVLPTVERTPRGGGAAYTD